MKPDAHSSPDEHETGQPLQLTRKSLLNIDHLPGTRLHEAAPLSPRPFQSLPAAHHPPLFEIAFVRRHELHRHDLALIGSQLALLINHSQKVGKIVEGGGVCDVVDEEEGIGAEVGGGPETTVFFLAGGVGEGEVVGAAIYLARDGVGVFDGGIVSFTQEVALATSSSPLMCSPLN